MGDKKIEYTSDDISNRSDRELDFNHVQFDPEFIQAATGVPAANLLRQIDIFLARKDVHACLTNIQANKKASEIIVGTAAQLYRLLDEAGWKEIRELGRNGRGLGKGRIRSEKLRLLRDGGKTLVTEEVPIEHHSTIITFENTRQGYLTDDAQTIRIYYAALLREKMMPYKGELDPAVQPEDNLQGHNVTIGQPPMSISDMLMLGIKFVGKRKNHVIETEKSQRGWESGFTREEMEIQGGYLKRHIEDLVRRSIRIKGYANAQLWRGGRLAQRADAMIEANLDDMRRITTCNLNGITNIGLLCEVVGSGDLQVNNQPCFFSNPHHASSEMQHYYRQNQLTLGHAPAPKYEQICFDDRMPMRQQIEAAIEQIKKCLFSTPNWHCRNWSARLDDIVQNHLERRQR